MTLRIGTRSDSPMCSFGATVGGSSWLANRLDFQQNPEVDACVVAAGDASPRSSYYCAMNIRATTATLGMALPKGRRPSASLRVHRRRYGPNDERDRPVKPLGLPRPD